MKAQPTLKEKGCKLKLATLLFACQLSISEAIELFVFAAR